MAEPPANRADHRLFPLFLLALVRWTDYRCPHCDAVFRRDYWPDNVRLGCGEKTCVGCAKIFDDGSREWPELKIGRKFRYLLPPGIIVMTAAFLIFGIGALIVAPSDVVNWLTVVVLVGGSLFPTLAWFMIRSVAIRHSKFRYEHEPVSMRRRLEGDRI